MSPPRYLRAGPGLAGLRACALRAARRQARSARRFIGCLLSLSLFLSLLSPLAGLRGTALEQWERTGGRLLGAASRKHLASPSPLPPSTCKLMETSPSNSAACAV